MSKLLIPNVNDKFESLKAFENATRSAAKYEGFAFSRKDSNLLGVKENCPLLFYDVQKVENGNITEETRKRKRNTRCDGCHAYIRAVVTNFIRPQLNEIATFSQYCTISPNLKNLVQQLHNNNEPTRIITAAINKHFVAIKLKPFVPVPPIINGWKKICLNLARYRKIYS
ncbi:hypothetical protein C2G38_2208033 [Gigaspora rosea]|uniref:Uncharacterized protein n=1 Tax=Gigaspora rosea TaxID=44941 RepID=A0A397UHW8_9GLOM|nr:hypothetical protein C2G38_2208033 [Gigaspora rosea]